MWNAGFVEHIALARESELLVEGHGLHLRVQVWFADAQATCLVEQAVQDQGADTPAAQPGKYRDAADLTGGVQAPGANWVTVQAGNDVNAGLILVIPLVGFRDLLLPDEDFTANTLQDGAIRVPAGEHTLYLRVRHERPLQ